MDLYPINICSIQLLWHQCLARFVAFRRLLDGDATLTTLNRVPWFCPIDHSTHTSTAALDVEMLYRSRVVGVDCTALCQTGHPFLTLFSPSEY